ncbi:SIR2 family protein [Marmoricola sp. Leaf446]|uniref:P-loop NTPase n=1 Tax=Marmoricola sp. Leaf446 TaxID=1736379 RepID=UPI0009E76EE3|nr:SIR2 family protein [Marmoricola sp. Leaf446]
MDLTYLVGASAADSLIRGVTAGRYHLLLGAGASLGGKSRSGVDLPGGVALAAELKQQFDLPLADTHLRRAFKLARSERSRAGEEFGDYINSRFTGVTPPDWMKILVQYPWQRIWTLNIDDAVERAYDAWSADAVVRARGVSWSENSSSATNDKEWVHVVHLHGRASKASRDGELVFSTTDYANAYGEKGYWHSHFAGEYESSPTIAVGASLDGEFDLENILERRKLTFDLPSFIIAPGITDDFAREYRSYDLTPIKATATEFFEALHLATTQVRGRADAAWSHPMMGVAFEKAWQRVDAAKPAAVDSRHDYYSGHAPTWSDIEKGMPATRHRVDGVVKRIVAQPRGDMGVHLLTGEACSGKSSALLLAARELLNRGFEPLLFVGSAAPDVEALAAYSRANPNAIFLFDGAEDFARDIGELAHHHGADHTIRVLMVDRSRALAHMKRSIPEHFMSQTILHAELTNKEIADLYDRLKQKNRLGHLATATQLEFANHFKVHQGRLFDGMASVENGRGFIDRVGDSYDELRRKPGVGLVRLAALTSMSGYGVPLTALTAASGLPAAEISRLVRETRIGDYVTVDSRELRLRSRHFGETLWNDFLPVPEKAEAAKRLVLAVAPFVDPSAISDDTLSYRIARSVMDEEFVRSVHGDKQSALHWYEDLERDYAWNARFWEQRALLASSAGRHEQALSWAVTAVAKWRDSFSLNTVGVVSMRRAVAEARPGKWPIDSFGDAEQYLRESRGRRSSGTGRDRAEYPYVSFFSGILDILQVTGRVEGRDRDTVQRNIMDWQVAAEDIRGEAQIEIARVVSRVVARWT